MRKRDKGNGRLVARIFLTHDGQTHSIDEWAAILGRNHWTFRKRCQTYPNNVAKIFATPVKGAPSKYTSRPKKEYNAWINMHLRCYKPSDKVYYRYGGRGIKVCKRWHKFQNFFEDMGKSPAGLTLERNNNDAGYCKSNCRWASQEAQCNNQSTNTKITFKGETRNIGEWSKLLGINRNALRRRFVKGYPLTTHAGTKRANLPKGADDDEAGQK